MRKSQEDSVRRYFDTLIAHWGPQDWWPARTRFEVIVGAYLTQNTAWSNVEKALKNLRQADRLHVAGIREIPRAELERLVRPAGYFRQKAQRLKNFVRYLDHRYAGSLARMFRQPTAELREQLLALNGIGPETADSILLYAGGHPVFVVDAYTRRVFERHAMLRGGEKYERIRELFERALDEGAGSGWLAEGFRPAAQLPGRKRRKFRVRRSSSKARVFDEYHALLVQVAKHHCFKKAPVCEGCPLQRFLPPDGPLLAAASQRKIPSTKMDVGRGRR